MWNGGLQVWGIDAKRALRKPEVVVRSLKKTEYLTRSRNSKQKETFEHKYSSPGVLRNPGEGHR